MRLFTVLLLCISLILASKGTPKQPTIFQEKQRSFLLACARGDTLQINSFLQNPQSLTNPVSLKRYELPRSVRCPSSIPLEVLGSPICLAVLSGKPKALKALLKDGRFDPRDAKNYAIRLAARFGRREMVRLLLEDGRAQPEAWQSVALCKACQYGHMVVVQLLLEHGSADPNDDEFSPLILACETGNLAIIELLLQEPRLRLPDAGPIALQAAISYRQYGVMARLLQDNRFSPTSDALELCILIGDSISTRMLLKDPRITHKAIEIQLNAYLERADFDPFLACLLFAHTPSPILLHDNLDRNHLYRNLFLCKQKGFKFFPNHVYSIAPVDLLVRCKSTMKVLTVPELNFYVQFMRGYVEHPDYEPESISLTLFDTLDYALSCARRSLDIKLVKALLRHFTEGHNIRSLYYLIRSCRETGMRELTGLIFMRIENLSMRMICGRLDVPTELGLYIQEFRFLEYMGM